MDTTFTLLRGANQKKMNACSTNQQDVNININMPYEGVGDWENLKGENDTTVWTVIRFTESGVAKIIDYAEKNPHAGTLDIVTNVFPILRKNFANLASAQDHIRQITGRN